MERENKAFENNPPEPPPPYSPPPVIVVINPIGLDWLNSLERVNVQKNVTTQHGETVFALKRQLVPACCGSSLQLHLVDADGRLAITYRHVDSMFEPRLEVDIEGQYVAKIRSTGFAWSPKYIISDQEGKKVLKIKGPGMNRGEFILHIEDMQGQSVGVVTKKWSGVADEYFSDSHVLEAGFPRDLELRYKAAVVGLCVIFIQSANLQRR